MNLKITRRLATHSQCLVSNDTNSLTIKSFLLSQVDKTLVQFHFLHSPVVVLIDLFQQFFLVNPSEFQTNTNGLTCLIKDFVEFAGIDGTCVVSVKLLVNSLHQLPDILVSLKTF